MGFSQNNEEQIILDYFGDRSGTFLSIGENDGVTLSNVRALALTGKFKGVMVEPSPKAFGRLKDLYEGQTGFYCYPFALGGRNGTAVLNESGNLLNQQDVGLVSTFHQSEMDRFKRTVSYNPVEVKIFKWKTFLNRLKIREFNMISIDCEGSELYILPDMDLSKTELICIEWNSKPELKTEYEKYFDGFKLIYTSGENLIYAR